MITSQFAGQGYGILKNKGNLLKDEWLNDGSLSVVLEIPAGMQEELESELNRLTHGDVQIRILKTK
jgi:ribosome maturation protein SDO1